MASIKEAIRNSISVPARERYCSKQRERLHNRDFSVITNNCLAGVILHDLQLRFDTPTINLWFSQPSQFIRYAKHLREYSAAPLVEMESDRDYPVGILQHELGEVEIHFMHYHTFAESESKWRERSQRIHYDNLFIIMELGIHTTPELLAEFETIPCDNRAAIVNAAAQSDNSIELSVYDETFYPGKTLKYRNALAAKRFYDEFDYIEFFNSGIIYKR